MPAARRSISTELRRLAATPAFRRSFGYYALLVCLGLDVGVFGPTLPALAGQTRATLAEAGLLFLAGSLGGAVGTAVSGRVFERWNGHRVLGAAQLSAALLLALMPAVPWFSLLVVVVACKGVANGFLNTGANTLLIWTHGEKSGPYMNALHFFFGLGAFVSPIVVAQLAGTTGGYRAAYWTLAVFAGVVGLGMLALPGSPRPIVGGKPESTARGPASAGVPYAFVAVAALFLFFYVGAEISFGGWIYTYSVSLRLATAESAAYLTSAFWLSFTVGRLLSIPVAARFRPVQVVLAALTGCLACLGFVLLAPGSAVALWAAAIGLGFCMAPVWPTGFTLAGQSVDLSGRVSGMILLGDSVGGMILPSAVGKVIERAGPRAMVYLIFSSLVLDLLALAGMLRLRRKR